MDVHATGLPHPVVLKDAAEAWNASCSSNTPQKRLIQNPNMNFTSTLQPYRRITQDTKTHKHHLCQVQVHISMVVHFICLHLWVTFIQDAVELPAPSNSVVAILLSQHSILGAAPHQHL